VKRKVCVVTGSRAEYGLLKPLLAEIKNDGEMELQLIVTGMHLSSEFGLTFRDAEKDGFLIKEKIDILLDSDTPVGIARSMGLALKSFAEGYERLQPDCVVVLGDRFELFGVVAAALVSRIPVVHIHGGELTEGVFDDAIRHSITKMSHLHFTSTEEYRKRVIQLGEDPKRVFNVGALGIDNVKRLTLVPKEELEKEWVFTFAKHNILVTFHPVTLEDNTAQEQFRNVLDVMDGIPDMHIIFTKANADPGGKTINGMIDEYVSRNSRKAVAVTSMGTAKYLSTMKLVDAVVGNSSSGIIEAPSFRVPTVNIGDRQKGRVRAKSVIDCEPTKKGIKRAIERLYSEEFQKSLENVVNPYGDGNTAKRIKGILKSNDLTGIVKKSFYDMTGGRNEVL